MMIREKTEKFEEQYLSKYATKSVDSKGRRLKEKQCDIRTVFQRDRDRIIHSKAFRRLKHKTQVFIAPEGDHYRTRLTHTLEVAQISRTIARALNANEDLTEAIALGHDLGHTPFGHSGEIILNEILEGGFKHNKQSLRVVDYLEIKEGKENYGLNLTFEVRDGILNHRGDNDMPKTLEGKIVRLCDRIAYINHDIDDAIRAGVLTIESFPEEYLNILGWSHSERINNLINDVIANSKDSYDIKMSKEKEKYFNLLRQFMFEEVYLNKNAKKDEHKAKRVLKELFYFYKDNPEKLPKDRYKDYLNGNSNEAIRDYIAGMTDRFALNTYKDLFLPKY